MLVFGHHIGVLDDLEATFKDKLQAMKPPASLVMMKGSCSLDKRHDAERRFQSDPACKLAVLSVGAAGVGHFIVPRPLTMAQECVLLQKMQCITVPCTLCFIRMTFSGAGCL